MNNYQFDSQNWAFYFAFKSITVYNLFLREVLDAAFPSVSHDACPLRLLTHR